MNNLYNTFYSWIEKREKIASDSILVNDSEGEVPKSKLGYCVKFSDSGNSSTVATKQYMVYGVECDIFSYVVTDLANKPTQEYKVKGSTTVFELMTDTLRKQSYGYQTQMFPPLSDIPHVRKAEPQQAIISSISDPLRMGRVQIRYPWNKDVSKVEDGKTIYPNASPWIPMTTPFTGNDNGGFLMAPNPDDFVMVDYEDGNVERHFVSGALYKENPSWGATD
ncbi:MAG: hypothetical protein KBS81_02380, partial [Spirochaetales bacterium]|nr:hypothetical protein [Candidatus Physcosoma equi]